MLIRDLLKKTTKFLTLTSTFNKLYESQFLLSYVLNKNLIEIILNKDLVISDKKKKKFLKKIFLRNSGKPLSKIVGYKDFYSRKFFVNSYTLDPRPESELLVDSIKKLKKIKNKNLKILDLGTGSGCLLITIFLEIDRKNIYCVGIDKCEKALEIAKKNSIKFGIEKNFDFIKSDWFSKITDKFDLIVSNPPYIKKREIENLSVEVKNFDPYLSLNGGSSGLRAYKTIAKQSKKFLNENGLICLEIGSTQKNDVIKIFESYKFIKTFESKDLNNRDRVLIFKK